jgi:hypothetical protein
MRSVFVYVSYFIAYYEGALPTHHKTLLLVTVAEPTSEYTYTYGTYMHIYIPYTYSIVYIVSGLMSEYVQTQLRVLIPYTHTYIYTHIHTHTSFEVGE